tara:strand:- start:294 stop:527 length:234 start_codon:yes stop_codon:yes gene_type:complete
MFDNGINNEFEEAHQKGLQRGFDLGWSYKGRYYRQMVRDMLTKKNYLNTSGEETLKKLLSKMEKDKDNREDITINSW